MICVHLVGRSMETSLITSFIHGTRLRQLL